MIAVRQKQKTRHIGGFFIAWQSKGRCQITTDTKTHNGVNLKWLTSLPIVSPAKHALTYKPGAQCNSVIVDGPDTTRPEPKDKFDP
ncbi:hypothetical protein GCM10010971_17170 [Silvimonas amylolytica]|uniref:Uncharacterized protein n=1 Tax=Silvimonas amylolytica TaxID=449663 RepID=A0ABQ2PKN2_9NEIS|nr:hypothetical protein GCM10010971_17170 [Silvimonas amylolytica]